MHELELLRHTSIVIECAFVKRYFSSILLLMKLSKAERVFLDFLTEEMDDKNHVSNSYQLRIKFNLLLKKIGQPTYSDSTLHKCFGSLSENHLLYKLKGRGYYQVNPIFFYKGSEEDRAKLIRRQLEELNRVPINDHRRRLIIQSIHVMDSNDYYLASASEQPTDSNS
jgi:hypothetical protein